MGKGRDPKRLMKLMIYLLGCRPDEFGLVPDREGFVRMKDLIKALSEEPGWGYVRRSHVHEVLMTFRGDFLVFEDDRIKAVNPGEGVYAVDSVVPPKLLYHCVRRKAYPVVREKGIMPTEHHRVSLSTTKELALRMGKRRDSKPVLLTVQAQRAAFEAGMMFSRQGALIYMVDHVPVDYFSGPPVAKEKKEPEKRKRVPSLTQHVMPGSFILDMERSGELQRQQQKKRGQKKEIGWKKELGKHRRRHK